jgi:hypothetical protein
MSKVKSPTEKKRLSLTRDRRNLYGESPHSSRKNIPRGKQRRRRAERRIASQVLSAVGTVPVEMVLEDTQSAVKTQTRLKQLKGFRKVPDKPLELVIARKLERRKN